MANEKNITKQREDLVRLNKFLSHNSTYSRREADKIIEEGRVSIDGKVVTNLSN